MNKRSRSHPVQAASAIQAAVKGLESLPDPWLAHILSFLDLGSHRDVRFVSKHLRRVSRMRASWTHIVICNSILLKYLTGARPVELSLTPLNKRPDKASEEWRSLAGMLQYVKHLRVPQNWMMQLTELPTARRLRSIHITPNPRDTAEIWWWNSDWTRWLASCKHLKEIEWHMSHRAHRTMAFDGKEEEEFAKLPFRHVTVPIVPNHQLPLGRFVPIVPNHQLPLGRFAHCRTLRSLTVDGLAAMADSGPHFGRDFSQQVVERLKLVHDAPLTRLRLQTVGILQDIPAVLRECIHWPLVDFELDSSDEAGASCFWAEGLKVIIKCEWLLRRLTLKWHETQCEYLGEPLAVAFWKSQQHLKSLHLHNAPEHLLNHLDTLARLPHLEVFRFHYHHDLHGIKEMLYNLLLCVEQMKSLRVLEWNTEQLDVADVTRVLAVAFWLPLLESVEVYTRATHSSDLTNPKLVAQCAAFRAKGVYCRVAGLKHAC